MKKYLNDKDFLSGLLFLVLGSIYLGIAILTIPVADSSSVGAGFMPRVYGTIMVAISLILLITSAIRIRKETEAESKEKEKAMHVDPVDMVRIICGFAAVLLYVIFLKNIGFILCSIPLLIVLIILLTPAHVKSDFLEAGGKPVAYYGKIVLFSVVFTFVIYYLFSKGLGLSMPAGILKNILP